MRELLYLLGAIVGVVAAGYLLLNNKKKTKFSQEEMEEYGYGFIPGTHPILTIFISGKLIKKKNMNPLPLTHPNGIDEDSYFVGSFDDKMTDYIGAVPADKFLEIKKILVKGSADELLKHFSSESSSDVDKKYFEYRIKFAENQLETL